MKVQKRIAADMLKCSPKKIKLDPARAEDISEAITKKDIKGLVKEKAIIKKRTAETSRGRARKIKIQKSKGKRKGPGSKKGKKNAKMTKKDRWILKVRAQRKYAKELLSSEKIMKKIYRELYSKIKGGFLEANGIFRSIWKNTN